MPAALRADTRQTRFSSAARSVEVVAMVLAIGRFRSWISPIFSCFVACQQPRALLSKRPIWKGATRANRPYFYPPAYPLKLCITSERFDQHLAESPARFGRANLECPLLREARHVACNPP